MLYLALFIGCSILIAVIWQRGEVGRSPGMMAGMTACISAAAVMAVWAAVVGEFGDFEAMHLVFGLGVGIAFALAYYLLTRLADAGQLNFSISLLAIAMALPAIVGLALLGEGLELMTGIGYGAAAVALLFFGLGAKKAEIEEKVPFGAGFSLIVFFVFALGCLGLLLFNAVYMGQSSALFLTLSLTGAALVLGGLTFSQDVGLDRSEAIEGVVMGVLLSLAAMFLLLAMDQVAASRVFAVAAVVIISLTAILERFLFSRPIKALSYIGMIAAAAAAVLLLVY